MVKLKPAKQYLRDFYFIREGAIASRKMICWRDFITWISLPGNTTGRL